jgi:DNA-binding GntR family transcriptional regulator
MRGALPLIRKQPAPMTKASDRVYAEVKSLIMQGVLEPGAQIKEEELAEMCGVSRTPARDAMRRLEAEMFIYRTDSQRSFVYTWTKTDLEELYALRGMLESYAAQQAAVRIDAATLAKLKECNQLIGEALDQNPPDVTVFVAQNYAFHSLLYGAVGSDRLTAIIQRLVLIPVMNLTARQYSIEQLRRSHADHLEIVHALDSRDQQWAGALMITHVRRAMYVHQTQDDSAP